MKIKTTLAAIATATIFAGASIANAETVSLGSTKGGAVAQIAAAVASAVSSHSEVQMRPQKMSGSQQYVDAVDLGKVDFGVANIMQYSMAKNGTGLSDGNVHDNLRLVGVLVPFVTGIMVSNESGIKTLADLKGKRIPTGYGSSPLFVAFWDAFLGSAGISYDDVDGVTVASLPKSWAAFKAGEVDAVIAGVGSGAVKEMNSVVKGGIRFIPLIASADVDAALPGSTIAPVEPSEKLVGVIEPTNTQHYTQTIFVGNHVDDDTVYNVVKTIFENTEELKATSPLWRAYDPANLARDYGVEYHPGAVKFFKEVGLIKN